MRDFREALREADRKNAEAGMPADVDRRLRERLGFIEAPKRSFAWQPFAIGAAALAALLLLVVGLYRPIPKSVGEFAVLEASRDFKAQQVGDEVQITSGVATLVDESEGISLAASTPGAIRKESTGVRVVAGVFKAAVVKRKAGSNPVRVLVAGGAIEVLGTQFTVSQVPGAANGQVTLHEGSIRFVATDGRQVLLTPGESLSWPLPPPPPPVAVPEPPVAVEPPALPPVEPAQPVKPVVPAVRTPVAPVQPTVPEAERIEDLLQRIDVQRSRGQFDAASAELTRALQAGYSAPTRERLSFELGTIWSRPGSDPSRACAHWREHSQRFPNGRYDREIEQAVGRLGCPGP